MNRITPGSCIQTIYRPFVNIRTVNLRENGAGNLDDAAVLCGSLTGHRSRVAEFHRHCRPIIAKTFPLEEIVEAHRYLESNQQIGKVVVTV
jgi:NADPH:quinone reductase-like Zn-dependent oxidoreductase